MKLKLTLFLCFSYCLTHAQSLNYYSIEGGGKWQSITILVPAGNDKLTKAYYNSSTAKEIQIIHEGKQIKKDTVEASYITIGSSPQKYIIVIPSNGKYLVLSDEKQMFTTVFNLDSNLFNPVQNPSKPAVSPNIAMSLLKLGAKLLLL